jgi:hypothetical protein
MGLVDGKQAQGALPEQVQGVFAQQAFRGDVEQVELAIEQGFFGLATGIGIQAGIQNPGPYPVVPECFDLVAHQGDQR